MPVSTIISGNNNLLNCVDSSSSNNNNNFQKLRQGIIYTSDLNLTIDSSVSLVSPTSIISSSSSLSSSSSPSSIVSSSSSNYPPSETTVYEESIKSSEESITTETDEETTVERKKVDEKPTLKELKTLEIEKLLINFAANRSSTSSTTTTTTVNNSDYIDVSSTTNSDKGLEKQSKLTNEEIENESSLILKEIYCSNSDDLESEDCDFDFDDDTILNHFDEGSNSRINCIQELIVDEDDEDDEDEDDEQKTNHTTSCENSNCSEGNKTEEKYLSLENPNAALCKFCQDGKEHPCKDNLIWSIKLPIDLIETLIQLCPTFFDNFEEVDMDPMDVSGSDEVLIEDDDDSTRDSTAVDIASSTSSPPEDDGGGNGNQPEPSPPNLQVDDSPLQVNKNKESLKVKLLMRRPMNQLIEQGILPPPKTPPAFAGQRVRLERARMGDLLKAKIQQRPARQELIRQHILEDSNARVAPLLAEKQRMLKKARLADSLNDHLIHRPGPLELVQKNILHAPDVIEKAVKEGVVNFKATSEGSIPGPHVANMYIGSEDESSSSDLSSPAGTPDQAPQTLLVNNEQTGKFVITSTGITSTAQIVPSSPTCISSSAPTTFTPPPPPPMPTFIIHDSNISKFVQGSSPTTTTNIPITVSAAQLNRLIDFTGGNQAQLGNLIAGLANQQQQQQQSNNSNLNQIQPNQQSSTINKIRSSKKSSKTKSQPKARQIKFHEYKGPPNSKAQSSLQASLQQPAESSYELLLQQQQLFLQWQLEWQHKYPQIILPAVSKITSPSEVTGKLTSLVASAAASSSLHKSGNNTINSIISGNTTTVLSPSTIISSTQPQPIAPAPMKIDTCQSPISIITPTLTLHQNQNNKSNSDIRSKIAIKIDSFSQAKGNQQNLNKIVNSNNSSSTNNNNNNSNNNNGTQGSNNSNSNNNNNNNNNVSSSGSTHSLPNFAKLNDWKVSDLKAELKKHNLTVSGSKPQLIERLKTLANNITNNDQRVQDESISTTSTSTTVVNSNKSTFIKNEAPSSEELSSGDGEMMDVGEADVNNEKSINGENYNNNNNNNNQQQPKLINIFGKNLDGSKIMKTIMTNSTMNKNDSSNQEEQNSKSNSNNNGYNIIIDESLIREQQKQIEQLQQALKLSQHQLQQMKLTQQSGGQKHRLALQHHLQQKIQQQALQTQLQKLIQLHSIQQQQQKSNQITNHNHKQPTTPIMVQQTKSQVSNDKEDKSESSLKSDNSNSTPIILTTRNSSNLNNLPFTIVKISSKPTTIIQKPKMEDEHKQGQQNDNIIPQLQIPEDKVSFQIKVGENEKNITGQSSKTIPFVNSMSSVNNTNSAAGDHQMDHSWLLKINEQPQDSSNHNKNGISSNIFDGASVTRASAGQQQQQQQQQQQTTQNIPNSNQVINKGSGNQDKKGFKSQIVDDVLEILIRNGELPESAQEDPTTPIKTPQTIQYPSNVSKPPPPPPLPPVTFAITLPTSISFSKNQPNPAVTNIPMLNLNNFLATANTNNASKPSSFMAQSNQQQQQQQQHKSELTKEEQDILKISEVLSKFGRDHTNQERNKNLLSHHQNQNRNHDDNNTLAMLLGEVEKDLNLDTMDVVLEEEQQHAQQLEQQQHQNNLNNFSQINPDNFMLASHMNQQQQHSHSMSVDRSNDELFDALGTLLPTDLDSMPMEMDYSDWMDNLLPEQSNNNLNQLNTMNSPLISNSFNVHVNNNNNGGGGGVMLSSTCDSNQIQIPSTILSNNNENYSLHQRDPLLSSRSLDIFSAPTLSMNNNNNNSSSGDNINSSFNLGINNDKVGESGVPSPMAINENLLWDFAM